MILTLCLCALISAVLLILIILWQRHRDGTVYFDKAAALADETAQYQTVVHDVERRLAQGDLEDDDARAEKTAAARRLLKAKSDIDALANAAPVAPIAVFAGVFVLLIGAMVVYLGNGRHDFRDYPYSAQLKTWTKVAANDPDSLPPMALAAVLRQGKAKKANDPHYWLFVGRIEMMAENYYAGTKAFQRAQTLEGKDFRAWSELGEALTFVSKGIEGTEAVKNFQTALIHDPSDARAHYYLGKFALADGRYDEARAHFKTAQSSLDPNDGRNSVIDAQLKAVDVAQNGQSQMQDRIGAMVAGLETKLKNNPDDPEGWARLIRSYGVLEKADDRARVVAAMKAHYAQSPRIIDEILAKSDAAVGAEDTAGES
jgi:cytochrome c-type biogenesis protein CcmH